jgi:L-iditol 2-dehydrogenase
MKAALISGPRSVQLKDVPIPEIAPDEILVRMRACGICGTDIEKIQGEQITPPILGHEVAGDIEHVGEQVQGFSAVVLRPVGRAGNWRPDCAP